MRGVVPLSLVFGFGMRSSYFIIAEGLDVLRACVVFLVTSVAVGYLYCGTPSFAIFSILLFVVMLQMPMHGAGDRGRCPKCVADCSCLDGRKNSGERGVEATGESDLGAGIQLS